MDEYHRSSVLSQYLTFSAAGERYAVAIMKLREILPYTGITKVPMAPGCIRGLINLRGSAIPVVDLAIKLGVGSAPITNRTCVMIVDPPNGDEGSRAIGILVDSVSAVVELQTDELEDTPTFGTRAPSEYLDGLARVDEEFVPIISLNQILSEESLFAEGKIVDETKQEAEHGSVEGTARTTTGESEPISDSEASTRAEDSSGDEAKARDESSERRPAAATKRASSSKASAQRRNPRGRR